MNGKRILAVGAHPADIEFGCGPALLDAAERGAAIHIAVLSRGEAGTYGNRVAREEEARAAAALLGADIQFLATAGDTRLRADLDTTLQVAKHIRRIRPDVILAPSGHENQHPDHRETSRIVRDAYRLARYGKTPGLESHEPRKTQTFLFYDISSEALGGDGLTPILVDVSSQLERWKELMQCHASQVRSLDYVDLQLSRARTLGIQMGVKAALRLYSEGPLILESMEALSQASSPRL